MWSELAEILGLSERFRVTDEEQVRGPLAPSGTHTFTHSNTNTHTWLNKVEPLIVAHSELEIFTE